MIRQALRILLLILISSSLPAQTPTKPTPRTSPKAVNSPQDLHPFYLKMNFLGGVFEDPRHPKCGTGFIGWVQNGEAPPELIYIEDVFRRVKLDCTKSDLQKGNFSCLSDREITYSHKVDGRTYRAILRMTNKDVKRPTFQLQRYIDKERILLCNYRKVI